MNWITDFINWLSTILKWWIVVLPWERGIRVRLGKKKRILLPGVYLKLPIIHDVFIQTIRTRFIGLPIQTLTTKDGKTLTLNTSLGYAITDIEKLYESIYHPESTLAALACGAISQYVSTHDISDCSPLEIERETNNILAGREYGIGNVSFKVTSYAVVKTYRLLQENSWFPMDRHDDKYK